ncbi:MAG: hypothetical protein FWE05_01095 [Defluviitaleaceae bacterium]|nr:hypothetical protein [Defluviitaleaceae bacterium]
MSRYSFFIKYAKSGDTYSSIKSTIKIKPEVFQFNAAMEELRSEFLYSSVYLNKDGHEDEGANIEELDGMLDEMKEIINTLGSMAAAEASLRERGIVSKFNQYYEDITNKNSSLYKKLLTMNNRVRKADSLIEFYKNFAKCIPYFLPQD